MWFYFLIFLLITLFSLHKTRQTKIIFFIFSGVLLFFIAAFRGNIDRDYSGYIALYNKISTLNTFRIEPTFLIISEIVKQVFNNVLYLFIIYALLGVCLKFYAILKLTDFLLLSVLIYFSNFFIFHEMTQIRVGVASALILISIKPLLDRRLKTFLILIAIAFLFHYSAILALPLYFLNVKKTNIILFALIIPVSYLLFYFNISVSFLMDLIPIPEVTTRFHQYKSLSAISNTRVNVFNYLQLSRCVLALLFLWKWDLLQQNNKTSVILIKVYIIAISILVLFADIPALGARASELLMPVEIILIPYLLYLFRQKQLAVLLVIVIGLLFLCLNVFYTSLVSSYFS